MIVLLTVDFFYVDKDDLIIKFIIFLCVTIFTFIGSVICLIAWWRNKDDFKTALKDIKARMEVEKVETDDEESTATK